MEHMNNFTSFQSNWNPFFYQLLEESQHQQASDYEPVAMTTRSAVTSSLSYVFDSCGETSPLPNMSTSPIRFGSFSSMSHTAMAPISVSSQQGNTPSSGFVPSDDDDVFVNDSQDDSSEDWRSWNIATAPGCPGKSSFNQPFSIL